MCATLFAIMAVLAVAAYFYFKKESVVAVLSRILGNFSR